MMKLLLFAICTLVIPYCIGRIYDTVMKKTDYEPAYTLISGYMMMWAVFQLIAVPLIILQQKFTLLENSFKAVTIVMAFARIGMTAYTSRKSKKLPGSGRRSADPMTVPVLIVSGILWAVFAGTVVFQLWQSYHLAYADGDDAFYLPLSVIADNADTMYLSDPYTGDPTVIDYRHGLGPFPMWIAYLARVCGVKPGVMAQTLLPLALILLTYLIYYEIGKRLLEVKSGPTVREEKEARQKRHWQLALFMLLISLLQIFGNASIYTSATFLLTRSRQGKEALASIVLPMLFLVLLEIAKELEEKAKVSVPRILLLTCCGVSACLCSTMGSFLMGMMTMLAAVLFAVLYKNKKVFLLMAAACVPAACFALLYLKLK